jgi:hypothetical protein
MSTSEKKEFPFLGSLTATGFTDGKKKKRRGKKRGEINTWTLKADVVK